MPTELRTITYEDAIREALRDEMRRDNRVFVYGLDVADHKRILGTTRGLVEEFGAERCFSAPLSEDALAGFGIGAAMMGLRPVYVHTRADFLLLAMNQLMNIAATTRYGSGGKLSVPLVVRAVIGRGWGQGFQHSKSLHSFFAHVPGLKAILPTTPRDAKGLLTAAIRDDNPVICLEHRWLFWQQGEVPDGDCADALGTAKIIREGTDLTIVAVSWMNVEAKQAADVLQRRGVSVEIVDPRTIHPLDEETIVRSVEKTRRCVVADYDWRNCGWSAETASRVSERLFGRLKAPVERIGFPETHCPTTRPLENEFYPNAETLIRAAERALRLDPADLSGEEWHSYENRFKGPF